MQELTHAGGLEPKIPPETSRGGAERASGTSSGAWDCLSAFGGDSSDDDEPESWSDRQPDSPQSAQDDASGSHMAQIEVREALSHREFEACFRHKRPVLIRGGASSWPAVAGWANAAHLRGLLAEEVLVLRALDGQRFLKRDCAHERRAWSSVVDELFGGGGEGGEGEGEGGGEGGEGGGGNGGEGGRDGDSRAGSGADGREGDGDGARARLYARAPLQGTLRAEVPLDGLETLVGGAAEGSPHRFKEANCGVWLGSAGCVTPLHYDLCHGFLVGVLGVKAVTYFSPDDYGALDARPEQPELSTVDLEAWRQGDASAAGRAERSRHARFAEATAWHAELRPGDVLYTPPFWWHHVETTAEAAALSVLVPFDPAPEEPVHPCHFR